MSSKTQGAGLGLQAVGPYIVKGKLGHGGMGTVYRAYDKRLKRHVALKKVHEDRDSDPRARQRLLREARIAARLSHPNLIHIYDLLEDGDSDWIVMELIEGQSLREILKGGALPLWQTLEVTKGIASGLAAAHAAGVIHRDLKSGNIMVRFDRKPLQAIILDFGLARPFRRESHDSLQTTAGRILGTPYSMSPEQARGQAVDQRSDLFALGVLIYEMVTGRPPFVGEGALETLRLIAHAEHVPVREMVPEAPLALSQLVDNLLRKKPADRPQDVPEVLSRLETLSVSPGDHSLAWSGAEKAIVSSHEEAAKPAMGPSLTGERRLVTVVYCQGLVEGQDGFLPDADVLDETWQRFFDRSRDVVEAYGGHIEEIHDQKWIASFGYPSAFEENARRAYAAARTVVQEAPGLAADIAGVGLQARAGVHADAVVVLNTEAQTSRLVLGKSLNHAITLQEKAHDGGVLVSPETGALLVDRIQTVSRTHQPKPLVARHREMSLLVRLWRLALEGTGQAVWIEGEAGLGKTHLLESLKKELAGTSLHDPWWLQVHGDPCRPSSWPAAMLLKQVLNLDHRKESGSLGADSLVRWARQGVLTQTDRMALTPLLDLASNLPDGNSRENIEQALESLVDLLQHEVEERARRDQATIIVFEGYQWLSPALRALTARLAEACEALSVLLVVTGRPGTRPELTELHGSEIFLNPLDSEQSRDLVGLVAGDRPLDRSSVQTIQRRAAGVPLYLEALTETVLAPQTESNAIPIDLHDGLFAQLARAGTARGLAYIAALLGPHFTKAELSAFWPLDRETLAAQVQRLILERILVPVEGSADLLRFEHPLLQEMAAASLIEGDRDDLERRVLDGGFGKTLL